MAADRPIPDLSNIFDFQLLYDILKEQEERIDALEARIEVLHEESSTPT